MITIYDRNEIAIGSLSNEAPEATPFFNDIFTENIQTGVVGFEFDVPLTSKEAPLLEGLNLVSMKDSAGDLRLFTIVNIEDTSSETSKIRTVYAEDISITELNESFVAPFQTNSLKDALNNALGTSRWSIDIGYDASLAVDEFFETNEYMTSLEVFRNICNLWKVEIKFTCEVSRTAVSGRVAKVYTAKEYGSGKYFYYNRDLVEVTRTRFYGDTATAVIPILSNATGGLATLDGWMPNPPIKGFEKELNWDYVVSKDASEAIGSRRGHKFMLYQNLSTTDKQLVYREATSALLARKEPTYTYSMSVLFLENYLGVEGEDVRIGDTVWFKDVSGDIEFGVKARVIELKRSETDPSMDSVVFSNFVEISVTDSADVQALRNAILILNGKTEELREDVNTNTQDITNLDITVQGVVTSVDGKSSISIGPNPNPSPKIGDIWLEPTSGGYLHKAWSGTAWVVTFNPQDIIDVETAVDKAQEDATTATNSANSAVITANKAIEDAEFAQVTADGAVSDIVNVQQTISGLQTTVANKAEQSQVTQLAGQLTSTVATVDGHTSQITQMGADINLRVTQAQVDESILKDNTLIDTRNTNQQPSWYYSNYAKRLVRELKSREIIGITVGTATLGACETEVPWTDSGGGVITQTFRSSDGVFQRRSVSPSTWGDWSQVADSSNMVSQINISPESILIQSKRIHLAGDTTIDNAVIKSAMIDSMTADKLTAGIIDAAVITVTNLNAGNIKVGDLSGINIFGTAITNTFDYVEGGAQRIVGTTVLDRASMNINYSLPTSNASNDMTGIVTINPLTIGTSMSPVTPTTNDSRGWWWEMSSTGLTTSEGRGTSTKQLVLGKVGYTEAGTAKLGTGIRSVQGAMGQTGYNGRSILFSDQGLEVRPDAQNAGTLKNTGIELYGTSTFLDLHTASRTGGAGDDFGARIYASGDANASFTNNYSDLIISGNEFRIRARGSVQFQNIAATAFVDVYCRRVIQSNPALRANSVSALSASPSGYYPISFNPTQALMAMQVREVGMEGELSIVPDNSTEVLQRGVEGDGMDYSAQVTLLTEVVQRQVIELEELKRDLSKLIQTI